MQGQVFLGRYEIQRLLGEGGMGRVYLARQIDLHRHVVIKVMHERVAADPKFRERFQREMLLMARFQHPYAVTLYDAAPDTPEGPCLIMEYVRGETLDVILQRNHRLSPVRAGRFLRQTCEVLQVAHSQGIIHRDLKPSNLMVIDADTPHEKIKVMDFGLAKLVDSPSLKQMVDSGEEFMIGTPAYICPEQVRGEEMDHRGDLYSVGVILYELLTGQLPFSGMSTMDLLLAHAQDEPPRMETKSWVPPAIEAVVLSCLGKKPEDRPASAWDLAQMYEDALMVPADDPVQQAAEAPTEFETTQVPPLPEINDPSAGVYQLQAWMPEAIATYKLRGFILDVGGEVIENVPGRIRVRMGGKGSTYSERSRLGWLGLGSGHPIEMELQLFEANHQKRSNLWVTVILRYLGRSPDRYWRARCDQIFTDLRGYLIGSTMHMSK